MCFEMLGCMRVRDINDITAKTTARILCQLQNYLVRRICASSNQIEPKQKYETKVNIDLNSRIDGTEQCLEIKIEES